MKQMMKKMIFVCLGGMIQGLGMGLFLFPHAIPSGGAGGLAILLNFLTEINMGTSLWIVNFSLLLLGVKYLGKRFAIWTSIAITVTSLSVHIFENTLYIAQRILLYDLIVGSIFLGLGIGILMRFSVSNGGMGVVAFIIAYRRNILPGRPLFIINSTIFFLTAAVISWKIMIFALISQWISTQMIDYIYRLDFTYTYTLSWRKKP